MKVTIESESSEVIRRHISISDIEVGYLRMLICELLFHHSVYTSFTIVLNCIRLKLHFKSLNIKSRIGQLMEQ